MASLKHAREKLEELGYDPLEALVEIARNRNQLSELRVRAAIALLPYVYSQVPTKLDSAGTVDELAAEIREHLRATGIAEEVIETAAAK